VICLGKRASYTAGFFLELNRGAKSGAGMGVFSSGVGEENTRLTQRWASQELTVLKININ